MKRGALMTPCPTLTPILPDGPRKNPPNARGFQPRTFAGTALRTSHDNRSGRDSPGFEKDLPVDFDLFAEDTAAIDAAAHHPIDPAVAVISAAVPILPEVRPNPEITTTTEPALRVGPLEQIFSQKLIRQ